MEAKTFQLFKKVGMPAGSWFKAFGGELGFTSGFAAFLLGKNSHIYRYDMLLGNYTDMIDIKPMTRVFGGALQDLPTMPRSAHHDYFTHDSLAIRRTASTGTVFYTLRGYSVVNMAPMRTSKTNGLYILFRSKANPDELYHQELRTTSVVQGPSSFGEAR